MVTPDQIDRIDADPAILESLLERHLGDLKAFAGRVIESCGLDA